MNATIPTYSPAPPPPSNTSTITATGQQTVQFALVGIHVVGSAAGHPEMIWATFEHVDNAPAATHSYINERYIRDREPKRGAASNHGRVERALGVLLH